MNLNRIDSSFAYSKSFHGLEMDKFINTVNSELDENPHNRFRYRLNSAKTDKKRFYFDNVEYKTDLFDRVKTLGKHLLISLIVVIIGIVILVSVEIEILQIIGSVLLLGWIWKFYQFLAIIINFPKALILRNGYIYEKSVVSRTINNCFFDEINFIEYNNYKYFFFKKKRDIIEESVILFSDNENEKTELTNFFEKYIEIAHDIKYREFKKKSE